MRAGTHTLQTVCVMLAGLCAVAGCNGRTDGARDAQPGVLLSTTVGAQTEGVPAPAASLTEASPVTDFLRYGDTLRFDVDSVATLQDTIGGVVSTLRIRSEVRLPFTNDTAYTRGRIIMKYETTGATSVFGAPVGVAYVWARHDSTGYHSTIFWRNYVTGDTGRSATSTQFHVARAAIPTTPGSFILRGVVNDTTRTVGCSVCMLRLNCRSAGPLTEQELDSLLSAGGR